MPAATAKKAAPHTRKTAAKKTATRRLKAVSEAPVEAKPKANKRTYSFPRITRNNNAERAINVKITPEMARNWIALEGKNRPITQSVVERYAGLMGRNKWPNTGDTYKFDWNGEFIDGRHRARALVLAEELYGVEYILGDIALGLDPAVKMLINSGKPMTAAQALAIEGYEYYTETAAIIKIEAQMAAGASSGYRKNLTTADVLDEARKDPEEYAIAGKLAKDHRRRVQPMHPSAVAYACKRLRTISKKHADAFFELWFSGNGGPLFVAVDNRLREIAFDRTRVDRIAYVGLLFRAWNAWHEGVTPKSFPLWTRGGKAVKIPEPTTELRKLDGK